MLLKLLLAAGSFFLGGVGVLRASVLYESYALLTAGLALATFGVVMVPALRRQARPVFA